MLTDVWPLFGLVLRTPRLELRSPSLGAARRARRAGRRGRARPGHDAVPGPLDGPAARRARPVGRATPVASVGCAHPAAVDAELRGAGRRRAGRDPGRRRDGVRGDPRGAHRLLARPPAPWPRHRHRDARRRAAPGVRGPRCRLGGLVRRDRQPGLDRRLAQARLCRRRHQARGGARTAPDRAAVPARPADLGRPADRAGGDRGPRAVPRAARRGQPAPPHPFLDPEHAPGRSRR